MCIKNVRNVYSVGVGEGWGEFDLFKAMYNFLIIIKASCNEVTFPSVSL